MCIGSCPAQPGKYRDYESDAVKKHGPFMAVDSGANGGERVPPDEAKHLHKHLPGALVLWRRKGLLWHWHPQKAAAHCSSQDAIEAVDRAFNVKASLPKPSTSGNMECNALQQHTTVEPCTSRSLRGGCRQGTALSLRVFCWCSSARRTFYTHMLPRYSAADWGKHHTTLHHTGVDSKL